MKIKNKFIIFFSILLLASCNKEKKVSINKIISKGSLKELRVKKKEITKTLTKVNEELLQINIAIAKLDTVKKYPLVTTLIIQDTIFNHFVELQGNVQTKQNILIYPEIQGILKNIYVKEGQYVTKGQLLARIDDGGLQQQLARVKETTQLAKTTYKRQKRLWEQKIGSEIQFLQAKTNYKTQQNTVKQLEKQVAKSKIIAPFSGFIDNIIKEPGTLVAPSLGSEIFRIINLKKMYIEIEVPENYIANISKGKVAEVYFPVLNKTIMTKINRVGNFINPANRSFKIEIDVPNNNRNIKPNLTAKVKINDYTSTKAFLLPQNIISENANGEQYVYIIKEKDKKTGVAIKNIIKTGQVQKDYIEIIEGITIGTEVVNEGARSVHDGQKVTIKNKN